MYNANNKVLEPLVVSDLIKSQERKETNLYTFKKKPVSSTKSTIQSLCPVSLNPTNMTLTYSAQNSVFNVIIEDSSCADWNVASNVPWITIVDPSTGFASNSSQVKFSITENTSSNSRSGVIKVNDVSFNVTQQGKTPCTITASVPSTSSTIFQSSGGGGMINVTATSGCSWTATVSGNTSWITILSGASGTGNGTIIYTVSPNTGTAKRIGTITVTNSIPIIITQYGASITTCNYEISPASKTFPYTASSGHIFTITTNDQSCTWKVVPTENWVTVTSGGSGTGNGAGNYSITLNNSNSTRTAEIKILGTTKSLVLIQEGKPVPPTCSILLNPSSYISEYQGGESSFTVSTNLSDCQWTASSNENWIFITSGSKGTGNGKVTFKIDQNLSKVSRSGKITINGAEFQITQKGFTGDSTNLGKAIDNTKLSWQTGGTLPFWVDTKEFYYGDSSAKSGPLSHSQSSWVQTIITGPGTLSFFWKVSSEIGFDTFKFTVNGVRYGEISGNIDWREFTMDIPEGTYTLRWTYSKDSTGSSGEDAGWLDKVEYKQAEEPLPVVIPLYRFYNPQLSAHFYTADKNEKEEVIKKFPYFQYEGIAYYVYSGQKASLLPVYRFYNVKTGVHFYTIDELEKEQIILMLPQFRYEGIAFYAFTSKQSFVKPVYRFFNKKTGTHFYTIDEVEKEYIINNYPQWIYEFISYYAIN